VISCVFYEERGTPYHPMWYSKWTSDTESVDKLASFLMTKHHSRGRERFGRHWVWQLSHNFAYFVISCVFYEEKVLRADMMLVIDDSWTIHIDVHLEYLMDCTSAVRTFFLIKHAWNHKIRKIMAQLSHSILPNRSLPREWCLVMRNDANLSTDSVSDVT